MQRLLCVEIIIAMNKLIVSCFFLLFFTNWVDAQFDSYGLPGQDFTYNGSPHMIENTSLSPIGVWSTWRVFHPIFGHYRIGAIGNIHGAGFGGVDPTDFMIMTPNNSTGSILLYPQVEEIFGLKIRPDGYSQFGGYLKIMGDETAAYPGEDRAIRYNTVLKEFEYYEGVSGVWLPLSGGGGNVFPSRIQDADGDTSVELEYTPDEDVINFRIDGLYGMHMEKNSTGTNVRLAMNRIGGLFDQLNVLVGESTGDKLVFDQARLNVFVGNLAGFNATTAGSNVAIGSQAGAYLLDSGYGNCLIGRSSDIEGNYNVIMGYKSGLLSGDSNVALGYNAGMNSAGDRNVYIGEQSGTDLNENDKLRIQTSLSAGVPLIYGEFDNDIVRINGELQVNDPLTTGYMLPSGQGSEGQFLKTNADGSTEWSTVTGSGSSPLDEIVDADNDTNIEVERSFDDDKIHFKMHGLSGILMENNLTGSNSRIVMNHTGTISQKNVLFGFNSGDNLVLNQGEANVFIGGESGVSATTAKSNVALGSLAGGILLDTGFGNTLIGTGADTEGNHNVAMGYESGVDSGDDNISIGQNAGENSVGDRNVYIGEHAAFGKNESDKLRIETSVSSDPLIYGEFDNAVVRINGELQVDDPSSTGYALPSGQGSEGQFLKTNADGTTEWATTISDIINLTPLNTEPSSPSAGDVYLDDGTNTGTGVGPKLRFYDGVFWINL